MSKEPNRNVYVGHRYVPKIMGEWDKSIDYEGLSIVTYQGNSFTSKKRVPVGIDISNEEFWVVTGNYDAQVEYYREETERVAEDLLLKSDKTYVDTELGKKSDKTYVDTELGKKANKTYVDTELGKKSDKTYVDTELDKKVSHIEHDDSITDIENKINKSKTFVLLSDFEKNPIENDDTQRIKRAVNSLKEHDTLHIDNSDDIFISDTILIDKDVDLIIDPVVVYTGSKNKPAIHLKDLFFSDIKIKKVVDEGSYLDDNEGYHGFNSDNYVGVLLDNLRECNVDIKTITGFTVGHKTMASGGSGNWFNNISIHRMLNNRVHNEINCNGFNSWVNGNTYYDSSCGYTSGYLPEDFDSLDINLYTILQTNTSGNTYIPNANIFNRFKFEIGVNDSVNWTQIKINRASGWKFNNYRFEFLADRKFCVIDMIDDIPEKIEFNPDFYLERVLGVNHKIHFENTMNLNRSLNEVARINTVPRYTLYSDHDITSKYFKITENYHALKGYMRMTPSELSLNEKSTEYSANDLLFKEGVRVTSSYPIILYIDDLNPGDEFLTEVLTFDNETPSLIYRFLDVNDNLITNHRINGYNIAGLRGFYSENVNGFVPNNTNFNDNQLITVNHENVKKMVIMISGNLRGINLYSMNYESKGKGIYKSADNINHIDKVMSNVKPAKLSNSGFYPGDVVIDYNDVTKGWVLNTEWEEF